MASFDRLQRRRYQEIENIEREEAPSEELKENWYEEEGKKSCECFDVLIVDDDNFNLTVIETFINMYPKPYRIKKAFNGMNCISTLERHCSKCKLQLSQSCILIFMDINMPFMGGHECGRVLKERMKNNIMKYIPIIANSANTAEMTGKLPHYFDDMIPKPIQRLELFAFLQKHIETPSIQAHMGMRRISTLGQNKQVTDFH